MRFLCACPFDDFMKRFFVLVRVKIRKFAIALEINRKLSRCYCCSLSLFLERC